MWVEMIIIFDVAVLYLRKCCYDQLSDIIFITFNTKYDVVGYNSTAIHANDTLVFLQHS